jgi:hypothetical protein
MKFNRTQKKVIRAAEEGRAPEIDPYLVPGAGVIMVRGDKKCELCGKMAETRPYGPRGEEICWDCGQKDPAATNRQMKRVLFGESAQ